MGIGYEHEHLLPLVKALLAAGNRLQPHPATDQPFRPSQGGPYCPLVDPIDFDVVRDLPRRAEVQLDEDIDAIFCRHCWTVIYGGAHVPETVFQRPGRRPSLPVLPQQPDQLDP